MAHSSNSIACSWHSNNSVVQILQLDGYTYLRRSNSSKCMFNVKLEVVDYNKKHFEVGTRKYPMCYPVIDIPKVLSLKLIDVLNMFNYYSLKYLIMKIKS